MSGHCRLVPLSSNVVAIYSGDHLIAESATASPSPGSEGFIIISWRPVCDALDVQRGSAALLEQDLQRALPICLFIQVAVIFIDGRLGSDMAPAVCTRVTFRAPGLHASDLLTRF